MRLESEIQKWINGLAGKDGRPTPGGISSVLRYDDSPLSREMQAWATRQPVDARIAPSRHRSVHDAGRVLRALIEPRFYSAGTNIAKPPRAQLKPDLVLEDVIGGAFIIVELKRSAKAARESGTELLAYANCLLEQHQGPTAFLVLVSTSWTPLERHAIAELAQGDYPVLPLEYREEGAGETSPTLWVRSDLLPVADAKPFPARALQVYTKVFWLPQNWQAGSQMGPWINRIEHAVTALAREADRAKASGFVLVWCRSFGALSGSRGLRVPVFISMAVRNPCRPQNLRKRPPRSEALQDAMQFDDWEPSDDTASRLLLDFTFGDNLPFESAGHEGAWRDLSTRLKDENASILHFTPFGEIEDQVAHWRVHKRHALRPTVQDITAFPAWHPLTWLGALDALIDNSEHEPGDPAAWLAFRQGEALGKFNKPMVPRFNRRHLNDLAEQARFATTWSESFATHSEAPTPPFQIDGSGLRCDWPRMQPTLDFAYAVVSQEGDLARYSFALGVHVSSGCNNIERLVNERRRLQGEGLFLPPLLDARVDELERFFSPRVKPDPARPGTFLWDELNRW